VTVNVVLEIGVLDDPLTVTASGVIVNAGLNNVPPWAPYETHLP
jgi:hypothetical protein